MTARLSKLVDAALGLRPSVNDFVVFLRAKVVYSWVIYSKVMDFKMIYSKVIYSKMIHSKVIYPYVIHF